MSSLSIFCTNPRLSSFKGVNRISDADLMPMSSSAARLMGDQVANIGEEVKRWQEEKRELEARLAGFESFQKLVLKQSDEVILELIKDVKRQLKQRK